MPTRQSARIALTTLYILAGSLLGAVHASEDKAGDDIRRAWEETWNRDGVHALIRRHRDRVDAKRMSQHLFYLAKDPLPFRKLNFTLPNHDKNTLHEADVTSLHIESLLQFVAHRGSPQDR